jgi:hypothetical protein
LDFISEFEIILCDVRLIKSREYRRFPFLIINDRRGNGLNND